MHNMKSMPYIIGIKVRIYSSADQKQIVAKNDGVARFIYNRLVARDRELHSLQKVKISVWIREVCAFWMTDTSRSRSSGL